MNVFSGVFIFYFFDVFVVCLYSLTNSLPGTVLPDFYVLIRSFSGGMLRCLSILKSDLTV
jgi:hypothetical protein